MTNALTARTRKQLAIRGQIEALQALMTGGIESGALEQTIYDGASDKGHEQCEHFFGDGVYARALEIPAGTCVIGKLHKLARICVIAKGCCTYVDEFSRRTVKSPFVGEFRPGTKTAVYAHTDTLWIAIVGTDMKDPQEILETWAAASHEEYAAFAEGKA